MLILKTMAHETVWGGEKLLPYAGADINGNGKIGHLYSLCGEDGLETVILNGKDQNKPFRLWFEEHKGRFGLGHYDEFPLIIALVEACDNLSIQVHPDDEVAKAEEGASYGKNESWFFLEAPKQGVIYNGCLTDNKEEVLARLQSGEMLSVVDTLPVEAGDYVYVEAGTLHALTAGSFLYEIEENSPWTYRLYDYNRTDAQGKRRELHIDKAMKALKPKLKSKAGRMVEGDQEERRYLLKKLENVREYINESQTLECVTLLEGSCQEEGIFVTAGTTIVLEPGERVEGDLKLAMMARPK